jgi:acyl-CoA thioester hydrolase
MTSGKTPAALRGNLLITAHIPVRWSDQDVNGHVNNAKYFTFFEQTRIVWLQQQAALANTEGHGVVVAHAGCDYLRPIPYPETLEIRMYAGRRGRSSFTTHYEIFGADGRVQYADASAVLVWIDRKSGKALPLPESLREALGPFDSPPAPAA